MEQLLFRSVEPLTIGGVTFILRISTDGTALTADFEQNPYSVTAESLFDVQVTYGNTTKTLSIGSRHSGSVTFPWDSGVSRITLSGPSVSYGGSDMGSPASFPWGTVYGAPLPQSDFLPDGPERVSNIAVQCTVTAPEGRFPALLGVWVYRYNNLRGWQAVQALTLNSQCGGDAWFLMVTPFMTGDRIRYRYVTAYYASAEDALSRSSAYEAVSEEESPVYIVSDNGGYYVPYDLSYTSPTAGCPVQISWGTYRNMKGIFQLQRSADGGDWVLIYAGESNRFSDTAGNWENVRYRVRSYEGFGEYYSAWVEGELSAVGRTNVFLGAGGVPVPASGIYLGRDGQILSCIPLLHTHT